MRTVINRIVLGIMILLMIAHVQDQGSALYLMRYEDKYPSDVRGHEYRNFFQIPQIKRRLREILPKDRISLLTHVYTEERLFTMSSLSRIIKGTRTTLGIFVCLALVVTAAACNGSSGSAATTGASTTPNRSEPTSNKSQPKSPIRQIDFNNFTYPKLPTGKCSMNQVHLTNGRYDAPKSIAGKLPSVDCWSVELGAITYGDVTGDGEEEAIIELYAERGGTEASEDVFIYTMRDGNPVLLWKFETGDRADGGPRRIAAENGELVVDLYGVGAEIGKKLYGTEGVGACCPKHFTRTRYRWVGTQFQQDGLQEVFENPSGSSAPVISDTPSPP